MVNSPIRVSRRILKNQYTDEFGGYSKTWFTDGLKKENNEQEQEDCEMDGLAKMVGLDIEAIAIEVATKHNSSTAINSWEQQMPKLNGKCRGIESINSTPNEPIKPVVKPVAPSKPLAKQEDIFSPDKINNAFANLFGGGPVSNEKIMETPSFFEKHQEKARPKITLKGRNLSSVFSPIPCKP